MSIQTTVVPFSSCAVGGRISAQRPGIRPSTKSRKTASFSASSSIARAVPKAITER
jgi:hypothetical protein